LSLTRKQEWHTNGWKADVAGRQVVLQNIPFWQSNITSLLTQGRQLLLLYDAGEAYVHREFKGGAVAAAATKAVLSAAWQGSTAQ